MDNKKSSKNSLLIGGAVLGALVVGGAGGFAITKMTEPQAASQASFRFGNSNFSGGGSMAGGQFRSFAGSGGNGELRGAGGLGRMANASYFESAASSASSAGNSSAASTFSSLATVASSFSAVESSYMNMVKSAASATQSNG